MSTAVQMGDLDRVEDTRNGPRTRRELYRATWPEPDDEGMGTGRGWFDRKLEILLDGLATRVSPDHPAAPAARR